MNAALAYLEDDLPMPRRARHLYLVAVDGCIVEQAYETAYGNVIDFFDAGDTGSADDVEAIINYSTHCTASYVVGKPTTIDVIGAGQLMRSRKGTIDCATGNLTQLSQMLDNGAATTDLAYYPNGNLKTVTGPANLKGQRYALSYVYDTALSTYVASASDSFGYEGVPDFV